MKFPSEHKQQVRRRLRKQAARQLRQKGPQGVSVKSVMASENMTIGGFYSHFDSKEAMLAEALRAAFKETEAVLGHRNIDAGTLRLFFSRYLSEQHRDHPDRGCPIACLIGEVSRQDDGLKTVFQDGLKQLLHKMAEGIDQYSDRSARQQAMKIAAILIGGLQMARAVSDPIYSEEILGACLQQAQQMVE